MQALHQIRKDAFEFALAALDQDRSDHFLRQPSAMLGSDRRKITPDLAKTLRTVGIRHPQINRRAIAHHPERGAHGNGDGSADNPGLDPGQLDARRWIHGVLGFY
jgi:hypothetical protein